MLANREHFPNFYRTVPSDSDHNLARVALLRHFNWSRVATLYQDADSGSSRYSYVRCLSTIF